MLRTALRGGDGRNKVKLLALWAAPQGALSGLGSNASRAISTTAAQHQVIGIIAVSLNCSFDVVTDCPSSCGQKLDDSKQDVQATKPHGRGQLNSFYTFASPSDHGQRPRPDGLLIVYINEQTSSLPATINLTNLTSDGRLHLISFIQTHPPLSSGQLSF
ncbi:hypothetical protein Bbelb_337750 [Branchiostoma belcheri]|nr:hypothetical protein Bbelb_337750 [Branchiostoma belcheri]